MIICLHLKFIWPKTFDKDFTDLWKYSHCDSLWLVCHSVSSVQLLFPFQPKRVKADGFPPEAGPLRVSAPQGSFFLPLLLHTGCAGISWLLFWLYKKKPSNVILPFMNNKPTDRRTTDSSLNEHFLTNNGVERFAESHTTNVYKRGLQRFLE